tara:strand:- start:814 stop:1230 length:417 start_codon:yes stop_codon:yes gene_type:complete
MLKYYSKIEKEKLIFCLLRYSQITEYRTDLSPEEEFMQVSGRKIKKGIIVEAHRHLEIKRKTNLTQEAWVILEGKVKATFYDLDNSKLCEKIVEKGDVVVLFRGGHSMEVLEEDTCFYEFKNGPYYGLKIDKEKIDEK